VRVWRICRKYHAKDALNGRGGLFVSGRWHAKGRRVVYTSGTLALATLEVLVHVDHDQMPQDLVQIEVNVPDHFKIKRVKENKLPNDWRSFPSPAYLQELGSKWLEVERALVLEVPSAVIPKETNYLLNPTHPDLEKITVVSIEEFQYDPRFFK